MKKNKLSSLADKPYLVWSILFIIAPLLMVAYYALTDKSGAFSLASVEQIPSITAAPLLMSFNCFKPSTFKIVLITPESPNIVIQL